MTSPHLNPNPSLPFNLFFGAQIVWYYVWAEELDYEQFFFCLAYSTTYFNCYSSFTCFYCIILFALLSYHPFCEMKQQTKTFKVLPQIKAYKAQLTALEIFPFCCAQHRIAVTNLLQRTDPNRQPFGEFNIRMAHRLVHLHQLPSVINYEVMNKNRHRQLHKIHRRTSLYTTTKRHVICSSLLKRSVLHNTKTIRILQQWRHGILFEDGVLLLTSHLHGSNSSGLS